MTGETSPRLGCVLMASGLGARFGGNKLLEKVDGLPMATRAMRAMPADCFAARVLVTRWPDVAALCGGEGFAAIPNPDRENDPAVTIRLGLAALPPGLDGCLFAVCDQPWLTAQSVRRLCAAFAACREKPAALSWQGQRGNPILFPASLFPALRTLPPGRTGRFCLAQSGLTPLLVEAGDARELADVDMREDLDSSTQV